MHTKHRLRIDEGIWSCHDLISKQTSNKHDAVQSESTIYSSTASTGSLCQWTKRSAMDTALSLILVYSHTQPTAKLALTPLALSVTRVTEPLTVFPNHSSERNRFLWGKSNHDSLHLDSYETALVHQIDRDGGTRLYLGTLRILDAVKLV